MWSQRSLSLPLPPTLLSFLPLTFLLPADILRLILILRFSIQNSLLIEIKFAVTPPPLTPAPCRYLLVRCDICLCGLRIVVRLNQLVMADLLSYCFGYG